MVHLTKVLGAGVVYIIFTDFHTAFHAFTGGIGRETIFMPVFLEISVERKLDIFYTRHQQMHAIGWLVWKVYHPFEYDIRGL